MRHLRALRKLRAVLGEPPSTGRPDLMTTDDDPGPRRTPGRAPAGPDRRAAGAAGSPTSTRVARRHPDLADELRELWAAAQVAEELASSVDDETRRLGLGRRVAARSGDRAGTARGRCGDCEILGGAGPGRDGRGPPGPAGEPRPGRGAEAAAARGASASAEDVARFRAEAEAAGAARPPAHRRRPRRRRPRRPALTS